MNNQLGIVLNIHRIPKTQHVELHKDDLDHVGSSQDLSMDAQIGEDNHLATSMDP
jgi:hypothetical protein